MSCVLSVVSTTPAALSILSCRVDRHVHLPCLPAHHTVLAYQSSRIVMSSPHYSCVSARPAYAYVPLAASCAAEPLDVLSA